jgi:predicted Rossmann fold nucleotide-binding protein DprA/Smf involved in DNA uptake
VWYTVLRSTANRQLTKELQVAEKSNKTVAQELRERGTARLKEIREMIGPLVKEESELVEMVPSENIRFGTQENAPAPKRQETSSTSTPAPRRRRKGGTRADQAVKFIADNKGTSASEVAKALGIKPNYLYRVLSDLEKQNRVKKDGKKYSVPA